MTSQIELREPPLRTVTGRRPVMPLDARILEIAVEPKRPVEIAHALAGEFPDTSTQRIASRLKALVGRGLMVRHRPTGGPANGPGTSVYQTKKEEDDKTDG